MKLGLRMECLIVVLLILMVKNKENKKNGITAESCMNQLYGNMEKNMVYIKDLLTTMNQLWSKKSCLLMEKNKDYMNHGLIIRNHILQLHMLMVQNTELNNIGMKVDNPALILCMFKINKKDFTSLGMKMVPQKLSAIMYKTKNMVPIHSFTVYIASIHVNMIME